MAYALPYDTPEFLRGRMPSAELSREQAAMNAGARMIYAARRRRRAWREPARALPGATALPAHFAPRPLVLPPPPGWST
jgi:hypothetical protein